MKIYNRVLASYLLVCMIPLLLSVFSCVKLESSLQQTVIAEQQRVVQTVSQEMDRNIRNAEDLEELMLDGAVVEELCESEVFSEQDRTEKATLREALQTAVRQHQECRSAFLYFYRSGQIVSDQRGYEEGSIESYASYLGIESDVLLDTVENTAIREFPVIKNKNGKSYIWVLTYRYSSNYKERLVCTGMLLPVEDFLYDCGNGEIYLTDGKGNLLYGSEKAGEAAVVAENADEKDGTTIVLSDGKYVRTTLASEYPFLYYHYIVKQSVYYKPIRLAWMQVAVELTAYLGIGVLLSFVLTRKTYSPYEQILRYLRKKDPKRLEHETFQNLEQSLKLFEQEQDVLENKLKANQQQLQNTMISGLLSGYTSDLSVISQYLEDGQPYRVLLFCLENTEQSHFFDGIREDQKVTAYQMLFFATKNVLDEILLEKRSGVTLVMIGLVAALIETSDTDGDWKADIERSIPLLEEALDIRVCCCVSGAADKLSEAARGYSEAMQLLQRHKGKGEKGLLIYDEAAQKESQELSEASEPSHRKEVVDDAVMEEIRGYVAAQYSDPELNVSVIAEKWNLSLSSLSRKYRAKMGHGLLDEIHMARLKEAHQLLAEGSTVKETAEKVGYLEARALVRAFKRYEGVVPSQLKGK